MDNKTYVKNLLFESQVDDLLKNDEFIEKLSKKIISNASSKKNLEKYIKDVVSKNVDSFIRALYLRRDFFTREIKSGSL